MYLEPDIFLKLHFPSVQGDTYSCFPTFLGSRISHSLILSGIILVSTMVPFFNTLLIGFHNFDGWEQILRNSPFYFCRFFKESFLHASLLTSAKQPLTHGPGSQCAGSVYSWGTVHSINCCSGTEQVRDDFASWNLRID